MKMSQMDLLVTNVAELLTAAVQEVLQLMGQAVLEYQKESARTRLENHDLQQKLKELQQRTAQASDEVLNVSCPRDELNSVEVRVQEHLIYHEDSAVSMKTEQPECLSDNSVHINPVSGETGVDNQHRSPQGACDYTSKKQIPLSWVKSSPTRTIPNPSRGTRETPLGSNRVKVESKPEALECFITGNSEDAATQAPGVPMQDAPFANEHSQLPLSPFSDSISHFNQLFKSASSASKHVLRSRVENTIHTGLHSSPIISESREILHSCHVCGKTFATPSSLGAHFVCHSNERPFVCKSCKFRFSRLADLKKHERIHTGERPYNCSICGRRFNRTENLKRHLRKVHYGAVL